MPLETATYINQLVATNPVHNDQVAGADSHLRLLKAVLQAQFPNFTAAALASTNAQLDSAATAVNTNGVSILADTGAHFKTNATDAITNPAAGEIDLAPAGTAALKATAAGVTIPGTATVTGASTFTGAATFNGGASGPGCVPIGGTIIWWSDTLPSGNGTWAWANGQAISRTTYAAAFGIFGTTYGAGNGTTTFNLPDLRENVPVGKGTMGATTSPARITNFVTSTLGALWGECLHLLGISEMPSHDHGGVTGDTSDVVNYVQGTPAMTTGSNNNVMNQLGGGSVNYTQPLHHHSITAQGGGGSHNNVQPSIVCNWIIRVA